ncbi:hypothetical protein L227DRAFT_553834 [Lentinus tigrinus ALCF2SS1-6]|uniref:Uncharacterized protein n=2 Tax=Lentinus tigrinus TaxID=5365 RepID=A0A5C2RZ06_9APHY|nr:hypothetical protein L227DRAFT_553834 [Lentinus tigrinus ALCF2SS1-6]
MASVLLVAATFSAFAWATNHSTQPCHTGYCRWEHVDDYGYGRFDLSGPVSSISDLTPSAGWTILDCDPSAAAQDIRLVCHDPSKGCDHLYLNGPHHTIVRLPDECGSMAFAFVKDEWVHDDQSIPRHNRRFMAHRDSVGVVKGMTLSTNYSDLDHTRHGEVSFDALGFTGTASADESSSCFHWPTNWNCTGSTTPQPFNYTHTDNLYNKSFDCPQQGSTPGYAGDISVGLDTNINGSLVVGWALAGSMIHPKQKVEFYFGVNTTIAGTLDLKANLDGTLSSGKQTLLEVNLIPMTGIPGILDIGPALKILAEADAFLSANVDLSVDIAYAITDARLPFPVVADRAGSFDLDASNSGLQLSASPSAAVEGNVSLHLIPSLAIDFNLLHIFDTSVSMDFDASAALDMTLHADVDASISTDGSSSADANWGGCVNATTTLNLDVSADMDLPPIYTKDSSLSLWDYTWPLYSTCFNGSAPIGRRAHIDQSDDVMVSYRERVLNRYIKNTSPPSSAAQSLPSGCGSIGKGSLAPVIAKKATDSSSH